MQAGATLEIANGGALGTGQLDLVGTATQTATLAITGTTTIANNITVAGDPTFNVATGTTTTVSGVIADGASAGDIVVTGGGTLALTNTNTYTGPSTIDSGSTLALSGSGSIATSSSVAANGTFDISGTTSGASIKSLSGSGSVVTGNQTLTLTNPANALFSGVISGSGGLTLSGGVQTLSGINTYGGATTISNGATLNLSGAGSMANSAVTNNGAFNVTAKTGNVGLKGYTQSSTGSLSMNIAPTSNQQINVTGSASLGGGLSLTASAGTYAAGRYTLLTATGGVSGTFSSLSANSLAAYTPNYSYALAYDANDVFLDLTFNGPSAADTQRSLTQSAAALRSVFNQQTAVVNNSLNYDCAVFAENGICISGGGRFATTDAMTGEQTSTLLVAAYKSLNNTRVGAFVDQNASTPSVTGIAFDKAPMYGVFGVWNQNPDLSGYEVRLSSSWSNQNITQTRNVVGTSEAGVGSGALKAQALSAMVSYALPIEKTQWIASPYAGVRKTKVSRGAYTETSAVTTPLTYSDLNQDITTAMAGLRMSKKYENDLFVTASAGVEQVIGSKISTLDASGVAGLTATDFSANNAKTRPVASVGLSYAIDKNQRISLSALYRKEAFQSSGSTTGMLMYQIGL